MKAASKCVVKGLSVAWRTGIMMNNTFRIRYIASAKKKAVRLRFSVYVVYEGANSESLYRAPNTYSPVVA